MSDNRKWSAARANIRTLVFKREGVSSGIIRVRVTRSETERLWILEEYVYFPSLINMHRVRPYFAVCGESTTYISSFFFGFFFVRSVAKRWLKARARALLLFQLREYTLTESYHEDDVEVEFVSNDNLQANSEAPRGIDPNRDLNEAIAEERREMDTQRYRYVSFSLLPLPPFPRLFHPFRVFVRVQLFTPRTFPGDSWE